MVAQRLTQITPTAATPDQLWQRVEAAWCAVPQEHIQCPDPWPARSPDLSPIENMWSMVAQRLTQITPPAATSDQLWQRVEAAWSAVSQEHNQSL
ncbi:transposable element Tcb1 transposase [Trichonephila clavipes]|uniref:Transposable element Tcb1 transposase n=1 Tax=Trichonephila clavipes TaxID=2585209 RepID=A0A8X6SIJ1_TRICX|nr:transposable element Tcb1 transposase [Trichonephila clavipes]